MTPAEALKLIRELAAVRRIEYVGHALDRMEERNITHRDVICALSSPSTCVAAASDRWRVVGSDIDGEAVRVILKIRRNLLIITVMGD